MERFADELRKNRATTDDKTAIANETTNSHKPNINITEVFPTLTAEALKEDTSTINDIHVTEHSFKSGINKHTEVPEKIEKERKATIKKDDEESSEIKKELGDAAEQCIAEILKEKYIGYEINWFGDNNEGYDIAISKNGENIKYVEVKAISSYSGRINITSSEWNYAKIQRAAYDIYIVNASLGEYRIINNPYQQYIDGKINIEVDAIIY